MKLHTLALAALVAVAGQSFAQSTSTTPAATPPSKQQMQADKEQVKKDKDALAAAKKSGDPAAVKDAQDKLNADKAKAKADRQARKDAKAKTETSSTTTK